MQVDLQIADKRMEHHNVHTLLDVHESHCIARPNKGKSAARKHSKSTIAITNKLLLIRFHRASPGYRLPPLAAFSAASAAFCSISANSS